MADDIFGKFTDTLKKLGKEYDRDLRGATSPFRTEVKAGSDNIGTGRINSEKSSKLSNKQNYFDILSYQWYTSDISRRFRDDYYNNIEIDFAKNQQAKSKSIKDSLVSTVNDTVGNIKDTVVDSYNQIKDSAKNLLDGKKDTSGELLKEYQNQGLFKYYIKSFPFAKVYEFKPRDTLGVTVNALTTAFKMIDSIIDTNGNKSDIMKDIWDGITGFLKSEFGLDVENASSFTDPNTRIYGVPNKMYKNLISGYFTGYYEIPILSNEDFIEVNGSDGWSQQSFTQRFFGDQAAGMVKNFMGEKIGSGFDIATRPKWTIDGGGDGFPATTLEVMLYNDNMTSVLNNLAFLHSFTAGALWYQDTFIQKCSSLYDVEFPGRFRYYFCTCDIKVGCVGKIRKINSYNNNFLAKYIDSGKINLEVLNHIPDAYRIQFTFKSLIPNNYNSYVAYIIGSKENEVTVGQNISSFYEKLAESIQTSVTQGDVQRTNRK